jgi:hypothetical protein
MFEPAFAAVFSDIKKTETGGMGISSVSGVYK